VTGPRTRRLLRYVAVGLGSVLIDAVVYAILYSTTGNGWVSKPIAYIAGAVFSYFANWRFTFGARRGRFSEVAFVLVYLSSLAVNLLVNQLILGWIEPTWWRAPLAFLVTTGFTTVWNYVGMSRFVFREPVEQVVDEERVETL
jgi:putative flippase GtrA